ncbi:MAG: HAD-IIB family hydrolase [Bdellovibrionales bacterium]|nr:HAD-IIB family hydrolase [Bdellovibrionales bacterium]
MDLPQPKLLAEADLSKIKGLCFDIDDTFSTHGKITDEAFTSLWNLRRAGYVLIPVTGRPAGWCDHIARFWPVDAVVGENGAFSMYMYEGRLQRFETLGDAEGAAARAKLQGLADAIVRQFPGVQFASDQNYREYDIAIDFCEDVTPWPESEVERLVKFCELKGAIAKISSIHVNAWFGRYTKIEGIRKFLAQTKAQLNLPLFEQFAFAGDSPNDEPMFAAFATSIGVQNVKPFLPKMKVYPKFITNNIAGAGFAEIAQALLK